MTTPDIPATPSTTDETNTARDSRTGGPTPDTYGQFSNQATGHARSAVYRAAVRRRTADVPINPAPVPDDEFSYEPRFSTIFGTDIAAFGQRDQQLQDHVRRAMYTMLREALARAGLPEPVWRDRGDGALLIVPHKVAHLMVDPFIAHLHAALRRHNRVSSEDAKIVLRTAMHIGYIHRDEDGLTGAAIVRMCRLLDAPAFKEAVATAGAPLGLVVSHQIYEAVIQPGTGLIDPDSYTEIIIENKETLTRAWLHLPSRAGVSL